MAKPRNLAVDLGRMVAATGVILLHLTPSTPVGEKFNTLFWIFCVPFFLTTSLFFFIKSSLKGPATRSPLKKIDRLVVPYLVWSLIYVVMRYVKYTIQGDNDTNFDPIGLILYGSAAVQLYFIPLLIYFRLQFFFGRLLCFGNFTWKQVVGSILGLAGLVGFGWFGGYQGYFNWSTTSFILGGLYIAAALLIVWLEKRGFNPIMRWGAIAGFIAVEVTNFFTYTQTDGNLFLELGLPVLGGLFSTLIALTFTAVSQNKLVIAGLSTTYGIYLAHHAVIEVFEFMGGRVGIDLQPYDIPEKLIFGAIVLGTTIALIFAVRLSRKLAYVVWGDVT